MLFYAYSMKQRMGAKIMNRNNEVPPHLTQDIKWDCKNLTILKHHKREPRGQPFPSRWPQGGNEQRRKHRNNTNDPPKKYRLGTVSKRILLEGFNQLHLSITFKMLCPQISNFCAFRY